MKFQILNVKLPQFEGPLELLLELINREKLEISQIALAEVTDQYLGAISDIEAVPPGELADFLVIASTLLLIKSRALLPRLAVSETETVEMISLEARLREYRRYREASKALKFLFESEAEIFTRSLWQGLTSRASSPSSPGGLLPLGHPPTAEDLATALRRITNELIVLLRPAETKVIARIASVEEKIKEIMQRVDGAARLTVGELAGSGSRAEMILAFLALLFLFRQKTIMLSQRTRFGLIEVVKAPGNE